MKLVNRSIGVKDLGGWGRIVKGFEDGKRF
jgi:hypothetical protein